MSDESIPADSEALSEIGLDENSLAELTGADAVAPADGQEPEAVAPEGDAKAEEAPAPNADEDLTPHERAIAALQEKDPEAAAALVEMLTADEPEGLAKVEPVPGSQDALPEDERVQLENAELNNTTAAAEQAAYVTHQRHQEAWAQYQYALKQRDAVMDRARENDEALDPGYVALLNSKIEQTLQANNAAAQDAQTAAFNHRLISDVAREIKNLPEFAKSPKTYFALRYHNQIRPDMPLLTQRDIFRAELKRQGLGPASKSPLSAEQREKMLKRVGKWKPNQSSGAPARVSRETQQTKSSKSPEIARWSNALARF